MKVPQTPPRRPVSATAVAIAILLLLLATVTAVLRGPRVAAGLLGVATAAVALRLLAGSRTRAAGGPAPPGVTRPAVLLVAGLLVLGGSLSWPELSGLFAGRGAGARAAAANITSATATSATAAPTLPTQVPATPTVPPTTFAGPSASMQPDRLTASATAPPGIDAGDQPVSYDAANLTDGDLTTAWRVAGNGIGTTLKAEWDTPVTLTAIALVPGYAKVDPADHTDRFHQERRVLAVRCTFDGGAPLTLTFADSPTLQAIAVDVTTRTVTIEITQTTPAPERDFTAISELAFQGHRA